MSDIESGVAAPASSAGPSETQHATSSGMRQPGASQYGSGLVFEGSEASASHRFQHMDSSTPHAWAAQQHAAGSPTPNPSWQLDPMSQLYAAGLAYDRAMSTPTQNGAPVSSGHNSNSATAWHTPPGQQPHVQQQHDMHGFATGYASPAWAHASGPPSAVPWGGHSPPAPSPYAVSHAPGMHMGYWQMQQHMQQQLVAAQLHYRKSG